MVFLAGMTISSCTCQRSVPEPPEQFSRPKGFVASLPTPRRPRAEGPEDGKLAAQRLTPQATIPEAALTPRYEAVDLPEDFPDEVPVFKDAEPFSVQELAAGARNVLFHVDAPQTEVFSFYRNTLSTNGWKVTQEFQAKEHAFLSFKKGDLVTNMTVSTDPRTGKQIIAIMYQTEEPLPFPEF
jgi:hypothetical protein